MRLGDPFDVENTNSEPIARRDQFDRDLILQTMLGKLSFQHLGGEFGCVDRAAKSTPQVGDGADMVLMGVGQQQSLQRIFTRRDKFRVGHLHVKTAATTTICITEGDTTIHHQPLLVVSVEVHIHTDFAATTKRYEP